VYEVVISRHEVSNPHYPTAPSFALSFKFSAPSSMCDIHLVPSY
jgi:hypothetical protein